MLIIYYYCCNRQQNKIIIDMVLKKYLAKLRQEKKTTTIQKLVGILNRSRQTIYSQIDINDYRDVIKRQCKIKITPAQLAILNRELTINVKTKAEILKKFKLTYNQHRVLCQRTESK